MRNRRDLQRQGGQLLAVVAAAVMALAGIDRVQAASAPAPTATTTLQVERRAAEFVVQAQAEVDADLTTAWATLSDYDHLREFIPGMSVSRTLSRTGPEAVVEQQGRAGFGPFRREFTIRLAVTETFPQTIRAEGIAGDFTHFSSRYELEPLSPTRTRIVYQAHLAPEIPVPSLIALPAMRSMIQQQFDALVKEVGRRARCLRPAESGSDDAQCNDASDVSESRDSLRVATIRREGGPRQ